MNIKDYILSYDFEGKMGYIYKNHKQNDIINTVLDILEETSTGSKLNIEWFNISMKFITDTIIFSDLSNEDKNTFIEKLFELNYFKNIEKYLYNDYLNIKHITIHSIGRISIKENVKYLENAFEKYLNKNPLICSKLLIEIDWLGSKNYRHYYSILEKNMDLINTMTLCIYLSSCSYNDKLVKLFNKFKIKFKEFFENKIIEASDYIYSYEIIVNNIFYKFSQKDWTREEYIKSIIYYTKHFELAEKFNGNKINYEKIYKEIIK
jgi:hypothetical protein